jgi:nitrogenase molybdenum-iron protein NifN
MATVLRRRKALSVSPLKSSQTLGGALAFMGVAQCIPMLHGSQGCTAFAKVFFVRHFREPIPLQTTAMDQISAVMGADDNVVEGLRAIASKTRPAVIGLLTTGLSETEGADVRAAVKAFRAAHPELAGVRVVAVEAPDYLGCFESGYAGAVKAIIEELVPSAAEAGTRAGKRRQQVNVLAGSLLTPGDLEALGELIGAFGLHPVFVPDLADSLDGHLLAQDFSPLTLGGIPLAEIERLGDARATLVIGAAMYPAAARLCELTRVPCHRFPHVLGLSACDALVDALARISGRPVPARIERQRAQLLDAMVDTHFVLGQARVAVAADPDLLAAFAELLREMGAETVVAVTSAHAPGLDALPLAEVQIGDLEDLEHSSREREVALVIGSSHAAASAARLGVPLLRAGFPLYDLIGGYQRSWIGYRGTRQALFDLANLLQSSERHRVLPYRSRFSQKHDPNYHGANPCNSYAGSSS